MVSGTGKCKPTIVIATKDSDAMMPIKCYLEDLETRIDPEVEDELWQQWRTFASGQWRGDIFSPKRMRSSQATIEWPAVFVNDAIDNVDRMAIQQLY